LWDTATWAEIDQAVADEVRRIGVARRVFATESLMDAQGNAPSWISDAPVGRRDGVVYIPEGEARPLVEVSVPFSLTPAQVENETVLHTARTLARLASKDLARAEDAMVFAGSAVASWPSGVRVPAVIRGGAPGLGTLGRRPLTINLAAPPSPAVALLNGVNQGISNMMAQGWPEPYGLVLGTDLYTAALSQVAPGSTETVLDRLKSWVQYLLPSAAVGDNRGVLVSLAGDPVTLYIGRDATPTFTGESHHADGTRYNFRVYERVRSVVRDPSCLRPLSS
jgi:uncharacterized linocin/CFP29 family protein